MASTTSSTSGFFSSPRQQQRLLWASGAVLVIGVAVLLAVILSRGSSQPAAATNISTISSGRATDTTPSPTKTVPVAHSALQTARTFIETAVLRVQPDVSYRLVGPFLKGGMSLKQWRTGNIPVQPYPAMNAKTAQFTTQTSTKNLILLEVVLDPRAGSGIKKPQAFEMRLDRIHGKWLVDNFVPRYKIPTLQATPN